MHEFLINQDNQLTKSARTVIAIREHIEQLPKTAATFKMRDLDAGVSSIKPIIVEFAGAWPEPDVFSGKKTGTKYINPNYMHARQYSDSLARCKCGAVFTKGYDINADTGISQEHGDDCLPYHRLRARADVLERRHKLIEHCTRLGWQGELLAKRLGITRNSVGGLARDVGVALNDRRDVYRTEAAETYIALVEEGDQDPNTVAKVYDHARNTLRRWATRFCDYEFEVGTNQYS